MNDNGWVSAAIRSQRTGEQVALVNLQEPKLQPGAVNAFKVVDGFRNLWQSSFHEHPLYITAEQDNLEVRLLAFPAERHATGYLQIKCVLQQRDALQPPQSSEDSADPLWDRLRRKLLGKRSK